MNDVLLLNIERLKLDEPAKSAAFDLLYWCPNVIFTSGRRDRKEQAEIMAGNVMENRRWIEQTYATSVASSICQKWVNDHPVATKSEIADGLFAELDELTDEEVGHLSRHLRGLAFDVQPVSGIEGKKIRDTIMRVSAKHNGKFLEREGGLVRWHIQF